jgi:hypothetical protein
LILTAILVASKFYKDVFNGNHFIAYIEGVSLEELNLLEVAFLKNVDWRLCIEPADYDFSLKSLIKNFAFLE